jgi:cyclic patellamide precursor peptide PatG
MPSSLQPADGSTVNPEYDADAVTTSGATSSEVAVTEGNKACGCNSCQAGSSREFVYSLGTIAPRFPNLSVEKELLQAVGRADAKDLTDRETLHSVLSKPENRYLVRQLCWVFSIERIDTYILAPRDPADLNLLMEAVRPHPSPADLDIVIGVKGPVASPEMCNGLQVPIVFFDQIYSFDRASLVGSIPRPKSTRAEDFGAVADELLDRILQLTGNAGLSDEHRAVNYLAVRYPAIYARTAEAFARNSSLSAVEARSSTLGGMRRIVDVILAFRDRTTDVVDKSFVRVDVTEEFPFLVSKLSPYYDR